jgi:hypothetical protein
MSFWAYYSPLGVGVLLTLMLHESVWGHAPLLPMWAHWPFVLSVGLGVGILCQLMLIGVQGAFAQVLPVPVGRSIRGQAAVVGGCLIIGCVVLAAVAGLLQSEGLATAALAVAALSLASVAGAVITYVWCWPTAARDFDKHPL